jgi:hypothetical protein
VSRQNIEYMDVALAFLILAPLVMVALFGLAILGSVRLMMWALKRYFHRYAAVGLGALAVIYLGYETIAGMRHCAEDPIYIPPKTGEGGEGTMLFNCDAPTGMYIYFFLYIIAPITILLICRFVFKVMTEKYEAPQ